MEDLESLLARLRSEDEDERMAAVCALDDLDDPRALQPLGRVALDSKEDAAVRREALLALGGFGPEADELIAAAVRSDSRVVRGEAKSLQRERRKRARDA